MKANISTKREKMIVIKRMETSQRKRCLLKENLHLAGILGAISQKGMYRGKMLNVDPNMERSMTSQYSCTLTDLF